LDGQLALVRRSNRHLYGWRFGVGTNGRSLAWTRASKNIIPVLGLASNLLVGSGNPGWPE
jgi:hypothetical protein